MSRRRKLIRINAAGDLAGAAEAVIAALNPIGWWKFNEGTGQVVTNYGSAGAGANLTLGTDATVTADDPAWTASGLSFTAADSDVAHCPGGTGGLGITGTDPFTFIYVGKSSGTGSTALMSGQWNNSTNTGQRRTLRAINSTGLKLRYEIEGGGHTATTLAVVENVWHFVGVTGTHANIQDAILYANGASEAASGASSVVVNTPDNNPRFSFGWANATPQTCEIAYGLVWESVLTPTQVANVRAALVTIMAARSITLP